MGDMKTPDAIIDKWSGTNAPYINKQDAKEAMKEYSKEVLKDYDNWKAHKTPQLVEQYIKEKGL
jgi:hypothetical protein